MDLQEELKSFHKKELVQIDINQSLESRKVVIEQRKKAEILGKKSFMQMESLIHNSKDELEFRYNEINKKSEEILELKRLVKEINKDKENIIKKIIVFTDQFDVINEFAMLTKNKGWEENMKGVLKVVDNNLKEIGITEVPALDEIFNEEQHECVDTVEDSLKEKYQIVKVYKKGYRYNGKVIRCASVVAIK